MIMHICIHIGKVLTRLIFISSHKGFKDFKYDFALYCYLHLGVGV